VGFKVLATALQAGYTVRGAIRREAQIDTIKSQASIQPFLDHLSFAIVPDITVDGAFDAALKDVTYVLHVASPLPGAVSISYPSHEPSESLTIPQGGANPENDIVRPAVHGTLSMLNSAAKVPSIRRLVITSSMVGVASDTAMAKGDTTTIYTPQTRVRPLPTGPYLTAPQAYLASKALALDAAEQFIADRRPHFSIVHVMPSYVFGANDLVTDATAIASGSNAILMGLVLGMAAPNASPGTVVHVDDVARIHVGALDEEKIPGNANLLASVPAQFEDALEIAARLFPEAVQDGRLPLRGKRVTLPMTVDVQDTVAIFGPLKGYEEMVESVVGQYLKLLAKA
jgi:nucleoside-diphosphate-sugar epimerase